METSEQMKLQFVDESNSKRPTNRLNFTNQRQLADFIEQEYAKSGYNDVGFAKYATQTLGFAVNKNNIKGLRISLNIPSNVVRVPGGKPKKTKKKRTNAVRFEEMAEKYDRLAERHDALATYFTDLQSRVLTLETFAKALQEHRNEG